MNSRSNNSFIQIVNAGTQCNVMQNGGKKINNGTDGKI